MKPRARVEVSRVLGPRLRGLIMGLKIKGCSPIISYHALPLPPEKIEEGRRIIERLKAKIPEYGNGIVYDRKLTYPLPRDPKTGRMMKAIRNGGS